MKSLITVTILVWTLVWIAAPSNATDSATVCTRTDHPGVYVGVNITGITGQKWAFRDVDQRTVEAWDAGRVVILGGQTRIPYDTIAVIDPRCA